jgi:uncharacterized protein HemY
MKFIRMDYSAFWVGFFIGILISMIVRKIMETTRRVENWELKSKKRKLADSDEIKSSTF